jgi:hypothetical protein
MVKYFFVPFYFSSVLSFQELRNVEECQKNCSVIESISFYRNFKKFLEVVMEVHEYVLNPSQIINISGHVLECRTEEEKRQE